MKKIGDEEKYIAQSYALTKIILSHGVRLMLLLLRNFQPIFVP